MKKLTTTLATAIFLLSSNAIAQPNPYDGNRRDAVQQGRDYGQRGDRDVRNDNQLGGRRNDNQRGDQNSNANTSTGVYHYQVEPNGRGEVPGPLHLSRGDRIPSQFESNYYVISDWKAKHLRQPQPGYHWVLVDDRYLLASIARGLSADSVAANR